MCSSVRAGDWVLLVTSQSTYVFVQAKPKEKFRLNKERVGAEPLIGAAFGTTFDVRNGQLVLGAASESSHATTAGTADNRNLVDDGSAQKLTSDDIARLRRDGASGQSIIDALVAGSETWAGKTDFAKEKWLKRKARKYMPWVRVLEPRAATIAEAYFARAGGQRLRPDTLAQMLARANARAGARVVAIDGTQGILIGALLERCASVLVPFVDRPPTFSALRHFNFDDVSSRLEFHGIENLPPANHALVVATTTFDPVSVLDVLLPKLRPSSPVVVFAATTQPLVRCYTLLKDAGCVDLLLTETWFRDFQVLPNRTHPNMSMSATGGFLLSATTTVLGTASSVQGRPLALDEQSGGTTTRVSVGTPSAVGGSVGSPQASADHHDGLLVASSPSSAAADAPSELGGVDTAAQPPSASPQHEACRGEDVALAAPE